MTILSCIVAATNSEQTPDIASKRQGTWTFLTNYAHVLVVVSRQSDIRARDIADSIGITERATLRIIAELVEEGYLEKTKTGRHNRYVINRGSALRHPVESMHTVGDLVDALSEASRVSR
jgi:predicted transcriptional regulator